MLESLLSFLLSIIQEPLFYISLPSCFVIYVVLFWKPSAISQNAYVRHRLFNDTLTAFGFEIRNLRSEKAGLLEKQLTHIIRKRGTLSQFYSGIYRGIRLYILDYRLELENINPTRTFISLTFKNKRNLSFQETFQMGSKTWIITGSDSRIYLHVNAPVRPAELQPYLEQAFKIIKAHHRNF